MSSSSWLVAFKEEEIKPIPSNRLILEASTAPQPSTLLQLLGEIRNRIYDFVFDEHYWLDPSESGNRWSTGRHPDDALSLLQSCRLIYKEAHLLSFTRGTIVMARFTLIHDLGWCSAPSYSPWDGLPSHAEAAVTTVAIRFNCRLMDLLLNRSADLRICCPCRTSIETGFLSLPSLGSLKKLDLVVRIYDEEEGTDSRKKRTGPIYTRVC